MALAWKAGFCLSVPEVVTRQAPRLDRAGNSGLVITGGSSGEATAAGKSFGYWSYFTEFQCYLAKVNIHIYLHLTKIYIYSCGVLHKLASSFHRDHAILLCLIHLGMCAADSFKNHRLKPSTAWI